MHCLWYYLHNISSAIVSTSLCRALHRKGRTRNMSCPRLQLPFYRPYCSIRRNRFSFVTFRYM